MGASEVGNATVPSLEVLCCWGRGRGWLGSLGRFREEDRGRPGIATGVGGWNWTPARESGGEAKDAHNTI